MASSNTNTNNQSADPYTQKNLDQNVTLKERVEDLVKFVEKCKFCMMTTKAADSGLLASRCMALAGTESNGIDLVFHANSESGKSDDLHKDSHVNLSFLQPSGEWASISGEASVESDREAVRKYYSPVLKAWIGDLGDGTHDGGPDDPRIVVIRVKAKTAQYSISKRTVIGAIVELAKGVATGETPEVNRLRHLSEEDLEQWRSTART